MADTDDAAVGKFLPHHGPTAQAAMAETNGTNGHGPVISAYTELGSTGLKRFSGYVREEFLPALQGKRGMETFREMRENDAVCGAMLFAIEYIARQVTWRIDKASEALDDIRAGEFVRTCLDDMSTTWADTIAEILSFLTYGWHYSELVYKRRKGDSQDPTERSVHTDGAIGWRKIATRSQDTLHQWIFDEDGGTQAMIQSAPPTYLLSTIPIIKALHFRPTTWKNNPEGRSILRSAYRPWFFGKKMEEYEAIGLERDLAGYPVLQVKEDPSKPGKPMGDVDPWGPSAEAARLKVICETFIRSVRRDEQEGALLPHWVEFKLLSTGSRRQYDTTEIIARYDQRKAMTVLADFILVGHEGTGSFSLHEDKTRLFGLALASFLDSIAEVFNRYAIPRLLALNGFAGSKMPKLAHASIDVPNLEELGAFITQLAGAGMVLFPEPELEAALMAAAKLPTKSKTEIAKAEARHSAQDRRLLVKAVRDFKATLGTKALTPRLAGMLEKWSEMDHPRDAEGADAGQFTEGSGGGGGLTEHDRSGESEAGFRSRTGRARPGDDDPSGFRQDNADRKGKSLPAVLARRRAAAKPSKTSTPKGARTAAETAGWHVAGVEAHGHGSIGGSVTIMEHPKRPGEQLAIGEGKYEHTAGDGQSQIGVGPLTEFGTARALNPPKPPKK